MTINQQVLSDRNGNLTGHDHFIIFWAVMAEAKSPGAEQKSEKRARTAGTRVVDFLPPFLWFHAHSIPPFPLRA